VRIQRLAAGAWVALAAGDTTDALRQAAAAADLDDTVEKHPVTPGAVRPARELYGDLLAEVGRPAEARAAYELALARQPGRARSVAAIAKLEKAVGQR
jgi:predicted negative regulator of RcsB-dependent stress response